MKTKHTNIHVKFRLFCVPSKEIWSFFDGRIKFPNIEFVKKLSICDDADFAGQGDGKTDGDVVADGRVSRICGHP